jgi:hypothetical protein
MCVGDTQIGAMWRHVTSISRLENHCYGSPMMAETMVDGMGVRRWYGMIPGSLMLSTSTAESQEVLGVFGVAVALPYLLKWRKERELGRPS